MVFFMRTPSVVSRKTAREVSRSTAVPGVREVAAGPISARPQGDELPVLECDDDERLVVLGGTVAGEPFADARRSLS